LRPHDIVVDIDAVLLSAYPAVSTYHYRKGYMRIQKKRNGKWWQELIHEREKDIQGEMM
jgi:hypothetical protein